MPSITPQDLWDLYPPGKRAVVDYYFDSFEPWDYRTDVSWPDIECVLFPDIDRGVTNWKKFGEMLRIWFPSLRTLMFSQNYTCDRADAFVAFMEDPWLAHIWIEDDQSDRFHKDAALSDLIEQSDEDIRHVRVFNCSHTDCARMEALLGDEMDEDGWSTKFDVWKAEHDMWDPLGKFRHENGIYAWLDTTSGMRPFPFVDIYQEDLRREE